MNVLILDAETTISSKGNPFDKTNKLVCVGVKWNMSGDSWKSVIFYDSYESLQEIINRADLIVGFNIKFDLHWLRQIGIDVSKIRVWDCQLAEFILNNQATPYPSLNDAANKYGYPPKIDIVKNEYWDKGINTDMIPRDNLSKYLEQDLVLTEQEYLKQLSLFKSDKRFNLFKLQCADLLVLEEMEWNGIKFATKKARTKAHELEEELSIITNELNTLIDGTPVNWNSNDNISCILYGGDIIESIRIPIGTYKTGAKLGQVRYKIVEKIYTMPRLTEPLKGTETKKSVEGKEYWEVNDTVLRKLKLNKKARNIVDLLTKFAEKDKLRGTYLIGWSNLIDTMHWEPDTLHGTLNQCVAITGRLSSSRPNLQNADPTTKIFCETRYIT